MPSCKNLYKRPSHTKRFIQSADVRRDATVKHKHTMESRISERKMEVRDYNLFHKSEDAGGYSRKEFPYGAISAGGLCNK